MTFTLEVEFTGLCLFLEHEDGEQVAVLQPDGRPGEDKEHMVHADGSLGVAHVGYIRFDLANILAATGTPSPPATAFMESPAFEVVYRFDRQHLDFGIKDSAPRTGTLELPRFEMIANESDPGSPPRVFPLLEPVQNLFSTDSLQVPRELLMRTILRGGDLSAEGKDGWEFPRYFRRGEPGRYSDDFTGQVFWTREVEDDGLTVTISDFDGSNAVEIPLQPVNDRIAIKVANLCSENPLEWNDFRLHTVIESDDDFKWLYRLLQPTLERTYDDLLLDVPFPVPMRDGGGAGVEDCMGGVLKVSCFC